VLLSSPRSWTQDLAAAVVVVVDSVAVAVVVVVAVVDSVAVVVVVDSVAVVVEEARFASAEVVRPLVELVFPTAEEPWAAFA